VPSAAPVLRKRVLKGRWEDVSNVVDFSRISGVSLEIIYRELIRYRRYNRPAAHRLPEDHAMLRSLPVELLTQLEIPVLAFQEADVYEMHRARSTGDLHFRNQGSRNDWVWVQAGTEEMYGALRGLLPAKLVALLKSQGLQIQRYCASGCRCSDPNSSQLRAPIGSTWPCYSADEEGRTRVYNSRYRDNPWSGASDPGGGPALAYK